jgi:serine/threonine protein kinase
MQESAKAELTVPEIGNWKGTERYEIVGRLGRGGMGAVYEAFDRERGQRVALKTLLHFDSTGLYLFKQEFRTLADVRHENLVRLHELVAAEDGQVFFTMELVRGQDFIAYLRNPAAASGVMLAQRASDAPPRGDAEPPTRPAPAARRERCQVDVGRLRAALRQLGEGIQALHAARKVHRDIKPSNVLVTDEGRVVLLDFGAATELSQPRADVSAGSGEVIGTACYMAPEQAGEDAAIPASDWYSVGVMLYEALVGRPPFSGSVIDVLTMKSRMAAPSPSEQVEGVPADLEALCRALLQPDPAARPTGVEVLRILGGMHTSTPPVQLADPTAVPALVGRKSHLRAMAEAFEESRHGRSVTVHVTGESGMGKSTVVQHFLDALVERDQALVLRGRAYERESVPYKAVDSVIDALSRHLIASEEAGEPIELPEGIWALARVFPVLLRVRGIEHGPEKADDALAVRALAFEALHEVLARLSARKPVIIFIDDAHWGDADSAALVLDVLRASAPLPLLLMMTERFVGTPSPFLAELKERWPENADARTLDVGSLAIDDARLLALSLLKTSEASDATAERTARAVAREAHGSPFLVEELVRCNHGATLAAGATLGVLSLDDMVGMRLGRLSADGQRVVDLVAVGGRPLPLSVLGDATGLGPTTVDEAVGRAVAERFLRIGMRDGREIAETSHDRIREALVGRLSDESLRDCHGRLARALEQARGMDAEDIARHWLGAGEPQAAVRVAARGAEDAAAKFAFDQAARLLSLSLENSDAPASELRRLRTRLAEVLQLAARHAESARVFLQVADGTPRGERVELQRAAAEQLLASGRIDEGKQVLYSVLATVGVKAPRSPLAAIVWLLIYRFWLVLLGLRFTERAPDDVARSRRLRVDALFTVSMGFGTVDPVLAACMQALHLIEALRYGDRFQVLRAVCMEAAHVGGAGKPETARERALLDLGRDLSERDATAEGKAFFDGARGTTLFQRGRWLEARELLTRHNGTGLTHASAATVRILTCLVHYNLGNFAENARLHARLCNEAVARGDIYTSVMLRSGSPLMLVVDDPEGARRGTEQALAQWPKTAFFVQHWQAMVGDPDVDLYEGEGGRAYDRIQRDLPKLEKGFLLHSVLIRVSTSFARGKCSVASIDTVPGLRKARLAEARAMARVLKREHDTWANALGWLVEGMAENASGQRAAAIAALRKGVDLSLATDSILYAVPAQHRLGQLIGGKEGRACIDQARAKMAAWGVHNPDRWLNVYMPGNWPAVSSSGLDS